ncbi:MAG: multicopper oxidase domain-containing protein [Dehalococcoidales bacterium]|nr:multicopper oxidase domain-containing protein [Dehalococcoidales bacterium]
MKTGEISRRYFIKAAGATAAAVALGNFAAFPAGCGPKKASFSNKLPIPPLAKNSSTDPSKAVFELTAQKGTSQFFEGKSTATLGYNGNYLGPVLRAKKGQQVSVRVKNMLDEETTVHWHGVLVPGEMDGGPHQTIAAGSEWNQSYVINQPAGTMWYHAHPLGTTGPQVYKGLAGLFIIDDEVLDNLNIPKDYGVNDVPLIVQDRRFADDGSLLYLNATDDDLHGMMGDKMMVNGVINPVLEVNAVKMRFRIVNGSNARIYDFRLSNNSKFNQIASDNGFLESPVELDTLEMSPGERAEIIVDFSGAAAGDVISLNSAELKIMDFQVKGTAADATSIPAKLTTISKIDEKSAAKTRTFTFTGGRERAGINSLQMNLKTGMDTIHETVKFGDTEIWEISDNTGIPHPFHIHGVHFQVLDRNGKPPPANESGWKDTVLVHNSEKVRTIATFGQKGIFMFHCHNLEHEDAGMMLQYEAK